VKLPNSLAMAHFLHVAGCFYPTILFFLGGGGLSGPRLGPLWGNACEKFHNPRTTPYGRKVCGTEKKKNNPKNSGHFAPLQRLRAVHALCSDLELKLSWAATIPSKFADPVQPQRTDPVLTSWYIFLGNGPYKDHFTIFGLYFTKLVLILPK
jgi:hypothetical protein